MGSKRQLKAIKSQVNASRKGKAGKEDEASNVEGDSLRAALGEGVGSTVYDSSTKLEQSMGLDLNTFFDVDLYGGLKTIRKPILQRKKTLLTTLLKDIAGHVTAILRDIIPSDIRGYRETQGYMAGIGDWSSMLKGHVHGWSKSSYFDLLLDLVETLEKVDEATGGSLRLNDVARFIKWDDPKMSILPSKGAQFNVPQHLLSVVFPHIVSLRRVSKEAFLEISSPAYLWESTLRRNVKEWTSQANLGDTVLVDSIIQYGIANVSRIYLDAVGSISYRITKSGLVSLAEDRNNRDIEKIVNGLVNNKQLADVWGPKAIDDLIALGKETQGVDRYQEHSGQPSSSIDESSSSTTTPVAESPPSDPQSVISGDEVIEEDDTTTEPPSMDGGPDIEKTAVEESDIEKTAVEEPEEEEEDDQL